MIADYIQDAGFAAVAAIGFATISNLPRRAYPYCALVAALGHSFRYFLMATLGWHIVAASFATALAVGVLAVVLSPLSRIPSEAYLYPSLLPMIPGVYAYKTVAGAAMCVLHQGEGEFMHWFYVFADNGLTCFFILLAMVLGATLPMFLLPRISFTATRS